MGGAFRVMQVGFLPAVFEHNTCQKLILKMLLTIPVVPGINCVKAT